VLWVEAPDVLEQSCEAIDSETIRLLNKADLAGSTEGLTEYDLVLSARDPAGVQALLDLLAMRVNEIYAGQEPALITRHRHRVALEACMFHVNHALDSRDEPLELMAESLRLALREIGRLTGRVDVEDLLDVIFSDFCIGK
jgi:tRNA modification GTPase